MDEEANGELWEAEQFRLTRPVPEVALLRALGNELLAACPQWHRGAAIRALGTGEMQEAARHVWRMVSLRPSWEEASRADVLHGRVWEWIDSQPTTTAVIPGLPGLDAAKQAETRGAAILARNTCL